MSDASPASGEERYGDGPGGQREVVFVLPAEWTAVEVDPARRDAAIKRMVERKMGRADQLAALRHVAVRAFREMASDAAEHGAFYAAILSERFEERPLAASFLAFLVPIGLDAADVPVTSFDDMLAILGQSSESEQLTEATTVELQVGPAVRTRARVKPTVTGTAGPPPELDVVRFFVPVEGTAAMLVLAYSTPILPIADVFAELFDEMAAAARWREPAGSAA